MSTSTTFTFKRTKGGRTHYVASVIPKTTVIDGFTDDPAKATKFSEADAKALLVVLESDKKVYGQWSVLDAGGREVAGFCHPTPEPKATKPLDLGPLPTVAEATAGRMATTNPPADRLLADEPDDSPFRELFGQFEDLGKYANDITLGGVAVAALQEIKALRESLDELTAPPKDDDTAVIDTTTGPAK